MGTQDHLLQITPSGGPPIDVATSLGAFEFGEVRCLPDCNACFLADGNKVKPRLRRYLIDDTGALGNETYVDMGGPELPPRYIGLY
jgi:hypothetical protein